MPRRTPTVPTRRSKRNRRYPAPAFPPAVRAPLMCDCYECRIDLFSGKVRTLTIAD